MQRTGDAAWGEFRPALRSAALQHSTEPPSTSRPLPGLPQAFRRRLLAHCGREGVDYTARFAWQELCELWGEGDGEAARAFLADLLHT